MINVADQLGIHVATVSRAVSEKWIQTPRGVFPLRRFFSGGTTSAEGEEMSWDAVKEKLKAIINFIDDTGYLRTPLDQIQRETKTPLTIDDLALALKLVQTLEPAGVAARSPEECLLLQLDALEEDEDLSEGHDFPLERTLVRDHLKDLEMNRYPQISKKLGRSIDDLKAAVRRLGRLSPHPGKQIGPTDAPPITPDATVYLNEETGKYDIEMAHDPVPLSISQMYQKMAKDRSADKTTREFLTNNVRNAKWLLEAIEQRKSTIQRVIRAVVDAQQEFFEKGPEFLKPLPMIGVADQLGIHVATVSRAVSEKWIQTPRGVFPLRRFFSGGTQNADGEDMSWDAVKEKLKIIIDHEDKKNPLNDDEIVEKLNAQGLTLARRTVAKYRKIMNIPTARQRREF
jgi:RNA polymerase sigma-54 factor